MKFKYAYLRIFYHEFCKSNKNHLGSINSKKANCYFGHFIVQSQLSHTLI